MARWRDYKSPPVLAPPSPPLHFITISASFQCDLTVGCGLLKDVLHLFKHGRQKPKIGIIHLGLLPGCISSPAFLVDWQLETYTHLWHWWHVEATAIEAFMTAGHMFHGSHSYTDTTGGRKNHPLPPHSSQTNKQKMQLTNKQGDHLFHKCHTHRWQEKRRKDIKQIHVAIWTNTFRQTAFLTNTYLAKLLNS